MEADRALKKGEVSWIVKSVGLWCGSGFRRFVGDRNVPAAVRAYALIFVCTDVVAEIWQGRNTDD